MSKFMHKNVRIKRIEIKKPNTCKNILKKRRHIGTLASEKSHMDVHSTHTMQNTMKSMGKFESVGKKNFSRMKLGIFWGVGGRKWRLVLIVG